MVQQDAAQANRSSSDQSSSEGSATAEAADHPAALHQPNEIDKLIQGKSDVEGIFELIKQRGTDFTDCNCVSALRQLSKLASSWDDGHLQSKVHKHPQFLALVDMVMAAAGTFNAEEYTAMIKCIGQLRFEDQDLLDDLARQLMALISDMGQTQLVQLVQGLAAADHSPSVALFDAVRAQAKELDGQVSAEQHQQLKQAFEKFGYGY